MRPHDAQRKADAAERAALKRKVRAAKEARIAAMWLAGEPMPVIAERVGHSGEHVARVLEKLNLRPKQAQRTNRRTTVGAIIEKVREA